jgi:two-component system response regulator HydG
LDEANQEFNKKIKGFQAEAMKFFLNYAWPGNVRELKNVIRRAVLLAESELIELGNFSTNNLKLSEEKIDLTKPLEKGISFKEMNQEFEKDLIKKALEAADGNKLKAAEFLKMNKKTFYRKIKSLRLLE